MFKDIGKLLAVGVALVAAGALLHLFVVTDTVLWLAIGALAIAIIL